MASTISNHDHELHKGRSLASAAQRTLEEAGERWTAMRTAVFDALAGFDRAASAYEIAETVSGRLDKRVAPNSVYRILDLFVANNLAKRVETANAFIVNRHPGCLHDCIFLICRQCGKAAHIDNDSIAESVREAAAARGFAPERPVIEVEGLCADCRAA